MNTITFIDQMLSTFKHETAFVVRDEDSVHGEARFTILANSRFYTGKKKLVWQKLSKLISKYNLELIESKPLGDDLYSFAVKVPKGSSQLPWSYLPHEEVCAV
jgi:hypothetical protein